MELLCIESHPNGKLLAGHIYDGIPSKHCGCDTFNVGHKGVFSIYGHEIKVGELMSCSICKNTFICDGFQYYNKRRFAQIAIETEVKKESNEFVKI